jgi:hypothetical protein
VPVFATIEQPSCAPSHTARTLTVRTAQWLGALARAPPGIRRGYVFEGWGRQNGMFHRKLDSPSTS